MAGTHYQRGNAFERRVKADLEKQGYIAWQTRGSKSAADILALKKRQTLLVQAKSGATSMSGTDWNALYTLATEIGAVPVLADRDGRRIRYRELTGLHAARSSFWPCRLFILDHITGR